MKDLHELASKYILKDDIYLFNTGNAVNAWKFYGCTYIPEEGLHRFVVWAPNAKRVSLTGEFNGWNNDADVMTPYRPFRRHEIQVLHRRCRRQKSA